MSARLKEAPTALMHILTAYDDMLIAEAALSISNERKCKFFYKNVIFLCLCIILQISLSYIESYELKIKYFKIMCFDFFPLWWTKQNRNRFSSSFK